MSYVRNQNTFTLTMCAANKATTAKPPPMFQPSVSSHQHHYYHRHKKKTKLKQENTFGKIVHTYVYIYIYHRTLGVMRMFQSEPRNSRWSIPARTTWAEVFFCTRDTVQCANWDSLSSAKVECALGPANIILHNDGCRIYFGRLFCLGALAELN